MPKLEWLVDQLQTTMDRMQAESEEHLTALQVRSSEIDLKLEDVQGQMRVVVQTAASAPGLSGAEPQVEASTSAPESFP